MINEPTPNHLQSPVSTPTHICAMVLIALFCYFAYANSFDGEFVFDDVAEIQDNPLFQAKTSYLQASFQGNLLPARPLPYASFYTNYLLHGVNTWGYHAVNLAIHLGNSSLLYILLFACFTRSSQTREKKLTGILLSCGVSLLWAVHPLQTQAVTYIYQRMESMMALFLLLTLVCLIQSTVSRRPALWQISSIVCCGLGMCCKESMIVTPLLAIWLDRAVLSESWQEIFARRARYYACLFATCLIVIVVVATQPYDELNGDAYERHSALQHLLSQPSVLLWYLRLCFWPFGQNIDYGWSVSSTLDHNVIVGLPFVFVIGLTVYSIWRNPPLSLILGSWFLLLAPTSSVIPVLAIAAEHRMYLPSAAVLTGVAILYFRAIQYSFPRLSFRTAGAVYFTTLLVAACLLARVTYERNSLYHDRLMIWQDTLSKNTRNPKAYMQVGIALFNRGRLSEATEYFEQSLLYNQSNASAYLWLGNALRRSDPQRATDYYRQALLIQPLLSEANNNLGSMLTLSDPKAAAEHFRAAITGNPRNVQAYNNLANLLARQGDLRAAISQYERALAIDPNFVAARTNLEIVRQQLKTQPTGP